MIYIGIDPHKAVHVVIVCDELGKELGRNSFPANLDGFRKLLKWVNTFGEERTWGCENPQTYGRGLAQFLLSQSETVHAVPAFLTGRFRFRSMSRDKSDFHDALAITRALIRELENLPEVMPEGPLDDLKTLLEHYDNLKSELVRVQNRLHAQLSQLDPSYKDRGRLSTQRALKHWLQVSKERVEQVRWQVTASLSKQGLNLLLETLKIEKQLKSFLENLEAQKLMSIQGIGTYVACKLIVETGNPHLFKSEAAWSHYAGTSPIQCSSGNNQRHRLNRGGNRQLNKALYQIVLTQMRYEPKAQAYIERRSKEGKTPREIRRCLKRLIARKVFKIMRSMSCFKHPNELKLQPQA